MNESERTEAVVCARLPMRRLLIATVTCACLVAITACGGTEPPTGRTFATPEEAVAELRRAVDAGQLDDLRAVFGPDAQALVDSSDAVTARRNREVFTVAMREGWRLEDAGTSRKTLVIGHEEWPFPIPLVSDGERWRFDTAAGKEEILARRIGRNELAVIRLCQTYVAAQRVYARRGHDGRPPGLFAAKFRSDPGKHNGLYWPAAAGATPSPLGDLVARATEEGTMSREAGPQPSPFHGYYFRILTAQGPSATAGAMDYLVDGALSRGFAMIAWPAQYDVTGVMTFIVNHEGVVRQKDLGPGTDATARAIRAYDPDPSWTPAE